jgi:hypothetical protein
MKDLPCGPVKTGEEFPTMTNIKVVAESHSKAASWNSNEDSPEKKTNVSWIPLDISTELQRDGPEWCDTDECQNLVRRRVYSVQVNVVLLDRRHVYRVVRFAGWTVVRLGAIS